MAADTAGTIFTMLVAAGLLGTIAIRLIGGEVRDELARFSLPLAATVATGAMAGSLYFSEIENFTPCELCWYQRIAMYPLAIILIVASLRRDQGIRPYAAVLAIGGSAISIYHYQLQAFPDQGSSCSTDAPCTFRWIEVFGFVSIPLLALGSFLIVLVLLSMPTPQSPTVLPQEPS